jgi:hypothetical protein
MLEGKPSMETKSIETLADFEDAVNRHDLTYSYSDDHSVWRRGCASEDRIRRAAEKFDRSDVERIWNAMVDRFLVEEARQQFYWQWPK